jgi:hypothetical protein
MSKMSDRQPAQPTMPPSRTYSEAFGDVTPAQAPVAEHAPYRPLPGEIDAALVEGIEEVRQWVLTAALCVAGLGVVGAMIPTPIPGFSRTVLSVMFLAAVFGVIWAMQLRMRGKAIEAANGRRAAGAHLSTLADLARKDGALREAMADLRIEDLSVKDAEHLIAVSNRAEAESDLRAVIGGEA